MNNITLLGRLGKDPEIKYFDSGKAKTTFSIAVTRSQKDKDGKYISDFFNCSAWGKTGEIITEHFKKGDLICVSGAVNINKYTDKAGLNREFIEVNVNSFSFAGNKNETSNS